MRLVFSECLARHAKLDQKAMANIRVAAAMMQLWGTNNPKPYLEEGLNRDEVDWAVEARMLFFRGLGIVRLQEMKSAGIQRVKVLGSGGRGRCEACRSDDQMAYPIDRAPVLPHEVCGCQTGCGCILVAVR